MPDLFPFAVIHIGVSVALAAMLILMHWQLHRADFLLYWPVFWLSIAASSVAHPLIAQGPPGPSPEQLRQQIATLAETYN